jgi:hypothetical protein
MCQKCVDAVARHYPGFTEEQQYELLVAATCFPFGSPEQVEKQLIELRAETDGTLDAALDFAHAKFMAAGKNV